MTFKEIFELKVGDEVLNGFIGGPVVNIVDYEDRNGNPVRRVDLGDQIHTQRVSMSIQAGTNAIGEWMDSWWNNAVVRNSN